MMLGVSAATEVTSASVAGPDGKNAAKQAVPYESFASPQVHRFPPVSWIILALFIVYSFFAPGFFSAGNLWNIGVQAAPLLVLAIGATLVILTEGIDLSCGIVLGFAGVGFALLMQRGYSVWVAMLGGILLAGICGLINGVMVASLNLPPFIATLGMASVITGVGLVSTGGTSIAVRNDVLDFVSNGALLGIKMPILIALAIFGAVLFLMRFTAFGRNVYALGGNPEALRLSGANLFGVTDCDLCRPADCWQGLRGFWSPPVLLPVISPRSWVGISMRLPPPS